MEEDNIRYFLKKDQVIQNQTKPLTTKRIQQSIEETKIQQRPQNKNDLVQRNMIMPAIEEQLIEEEKIIREVDMRWE